jgi:hypothetical protein
MVGGISALLTKVSQVPRIDQLGVHLVVVGKAAMLVELVAVVVGEDDHRLVENVELAQQVEELLEVRVDFADVDVVKTLEELDLGGVGDVAFQQDILEHGVHLVLAEC